MTHARPVLHGRIEVTERPPGEVTERPPRASRPDDRECAMLISHLLATKQAEVAKEVTRARLSDVTLRRLFRRQRITPEFFVKRLRSGCAGPAGFCFSPAQLHRGEDQGH